jgi:hypothetical protein
MLVPATRLLLLGVTRTPSDRTRIGGFDNDVESVDDSALVSRSQYINMVRK